MRTIGITLLWVASGCHALNFSCTEVGCQGTLTVFLDRALAGDAVVTVSFAGEDVTCAPDGACEVAEVDGQPAITIRTPMGVPEETWSLAISEGGAPAVPYEVTPVWDDETFYPNGEGCDDGCTSGEAELALD